VCFVVCCALWRIGRRRRSEATTTAGGGDGRTAIGGKTIGMEILGVNNHEFWKILFNTSVNVKHYF